MLKIYEYKGHTFQYEEGEQPEGAKLVQPKTKKRTAANKSRTTTTKKG